MTRSWSVFWHRASHWEYWPFWLVYLPVYFYFTWLAIKCRSFFFFTAANPQIDFGGMLGESKADIFSQIPKKYLPKHKRFEPGHHTEATQFVESALSYPFVAKPDIGERGKLVERIDSPEELRTYIQRCPVPFLLQEWVDFPIELGIFFIRNPHDSSGKITSIVQKDFLKVIGDGQHRICELLEKMPRAKIQLDFNHPRFEGIMESIPAMNEEVIVERIGNHCRGTAFLDASSHVSTDLNSAINKLATQIPNFHFGRFDLKCTNYSDLSELKNFKIIELNGAGAEPGHIYQPGYSIFKGYSAIFWHLKQLAIVSQLNHQKGHKYWSLAKGLKKMREIRQYNARIAHLV